MAVSRARLRAALAAMVATTAGLNAVYGYEPDLDTPELQNATYVIVELLDYSERIVSGTVSEQQRTALLHLVQQSNAADPHDNTNRQTLQTAIDTVRDALEQSVRASHTLSDGSGVVAFDCKLTGGIDAAFDFAADRTIVDSWLKLALRVQQ